MITKHVLAMSAGVIFATAGFTAAGTGTASAAYLCKATVVKGVSEPTRRSLKGKQEAKRAWEANARSQFRFSYRWLLANGSKLSYSTKGKEEIWFAVGYPCRIAGPEGHLTTSDMSEAERACASRPNLKTAKRYGCDEFYLLGN